MKKFFVLFIFMMCTITVVADGNNITNQKGTNVGAQFNSTVENGALETSLGGSFSDWDVWILGTDKQHYDGQQASLYFNVFNTDTYERIWRVQFNQFDFSDTFVAKNLQHATWNVEAYGFDRDSNELISAAFTISWDAVEVPEGADPNHYLYEYGCFEYKTFGNYKRRAADATVAYLVTRVSTGEVIAEGHTMGFGAIFNNMNLAHIKDVRECGG